MIGAEIEIRSGGATSRVRLDAYLGPQAEEQAHADAHDWIKSLRNVPVDGAPLRERFQVRGDSLWWFTEIYLHKLPVILDIHRTLAAMDALIDREQPTEIGLAGTPVVVRHVAREVAAARNVACRQAVRPITWWHRLARLDLRARALTTSALVAADRLRGAPVRRRRPEIAAFIHRAFWRDGDGAPSAESYLGPVLGELERRLAPGSVQYVGVGPTSNFRTRRRLLASGPHNVIAVERFAPIRRLAESRRVWKRRFEFFRVLSASPSLRERAIIRGVDCWPLVREQLAGVAWLQWPWSVRSMDEAGAALDALAPLTVLTYAEAGGWGRALVLEARRRGIPSAGIQHGFIYRHWLNYRHEPDEMEAHGTPAFPYPTRTLLFDDYAARHLTEQGRFPAGSLQVTGSPRFDELAAAVRAMTAADVERVRATLGLQESDALVLVATKEKEARRVLEPFLARAASVAGAVLVIKPHPAETSEQYAHFGRAYPHVRVTAPDAPLASLLAAARVIVTVNSTVAIDAGGLDIPALVIGLPNNLSPFVSSGAFVGSTDPDEAVTLLDRLMHDAAFRARVAERRLAVLGDAGETRDAAGRAARAVIALGHPAVPGTE